jgi:membrane protein
MLCAALPGRSCGLALCRALRFFPCGEAPGMAQKFFTESWEVLKESGSEFMEDKAMQQGAALAFFSILSMAPLLVISIAVAALVFDAQTAREQLVSQLTELVGPEGGEAIKTMLDNAQQPETGTLAAVLGIVTLLFGASGVFGQLQDALNTIWEVKPKEGQGIWGFIRNRFLSLTMVLGTGFLLLVSLILSTMISGLGTYLETVVPGMEAIWHVLNFLITMVVVTLLFAMIFKFLPDVKVAWSDVWVGAIVTAVLFAIGKLLIGLYLGKSGMGSTYGAAGSLVVLIVWIYYSAQILFFGAEITQVYARRYGSRIVPARGAEPITQEARAQQGLSPGKQQWGRA